MRPHSDANLLPVEIWRICPWPDVTPLENFLVCLQGPDQRVVPISIGDFEGKALYMAREGIPPLRPLPHNLIENLVERVRGEILELVIHTLKDDVFHAYLKVRTPHDEFELDCRPSDGMVLATLLAVPIYVSTAVMDEAGRQLGDTEDCAEVEDKAIHLDKARESAPQDGIPCRETDMGSLERLQAQLDWLVSEEAYEAAAKVRDKITTLKDENKEQS